MLERPINFNVAEYKKFSNMFSDSTMQLTFQEYFGVVKVKKIYYFLPLKKVKLLKEKF